MTPAQRVAAYRDRLRGPAGQTGRPVTAPHGTHAAFERHRRAGEPPCLECVEGEREHRAEMYRRRKAQ